MKPFPVEYVRFWELWRQGKYFECHEVLEDVWRVEEDAERKQFFQGVIHCSVALVHVERRNKVGALRQYFKARDKLAGVSSRYALPEVRTALQFVRKELVEVFGLDEDEEVRESEL